MSVPDIASGIGRGERWLATTAESGAVDSTAGASPAGDALVVAYTSQVRAQLYQQG